jgi:hypothetical protein
MRTVALSLALLAVVAGGPALAEKSGQTLQFEIQMATSDMQNSENVAKIKRTFDLAARQSGRQAIEISCAPGDSSWCAKEFVAACDKHDGGMSTNPEGSVTCSFPTK